MPETMDDARPVDGAGRPKVTVERVAGEGTGDSRRGAAWWVGGVRRRNLLGVVLLVAIVAAGGLWWLNRGLPDDVAVRVGETDVTEAELRDRMATLEALYSVSAPEDADKRAEYWRDAAQSVALGIVLADAAAAEDITVTDNDVDLALQQVVASFFGKGEKGEAAFAQALADVGTSEEAVRVELRRQLEINALFASVTSDVGTPTDEEVQNAYDDRRCTLVLPDQRRIRNIVVPTRADANEAVRRLRAGDSFASVVASLSIDASTQASGGDLGFVAAADLEPDYSAAAFGVAEGKLFGPVKSRYGWNLGQVVDIRKGRIPAFREVSDQLRRALFDEAQSREWRSWMRAQLEEAEVEYADDYRPDDPLELPENTTVDPEGSSEPATDAADC